jgi:hypothetical protein
VHFVHSPPPASSAISAWNELKSSNDR